MHVHNMVSREKEAINKTIKIRFKSSLPQCWYIKMIIDFLDIIHRPVQSRDREYNNWSQLNRFVAWGRRQNTVSKTLF
jgi:hypothetical protein